MSSSSSNPFVMLMNPEAVIRAVEGSKRLASLNSRVFHPLDRPIIPCKRSEAMKAYDRRVDGRDAEDAATDFGSPAARADGSA